MQFKRYFFKHLWMVLDLFFHTIGISVGVGSVVFGCLLFYFATIKFVSGNILWGVVSIILGPIIGIMLSYIGERFQDKYMIKW